MSGLSEKTTVCLCFLQFLIDSKNEILDLICIAYLIFDVIEKLKLFLFANFFDLQQPMK